MPNETKQSCATAYKTMIGGQALIEGIMMLGPEKKAVVVRKPDGGLEEQVEERVLIKDKHPALGLPLLRGVFNFCSSLANGVKALMYSASFFPEAQPAGRRGAYRHLHGLSDALFPYEGHPPGVPVPRRGAQDHLLL